MIKSLTISNLQDLSIFNKPLFTIRKKNILSFELKKSHLDSNLNTDNECVSAIAKTRYQVASNIVKVYFHKDSS